MKVVRRPLSVGELAGHLGIDDVAELERSLDQAKLMEEHAQVVEIPHSCGPDESVSVIPLTELLTVLRSGGDLTQVLAVTADEALWTGNDQALALTAVGLFIARMPDWSRRAIYGFAFSRTDSAVYGDFPTPEDLLWICDAVHRSGPPTSFDLRQRQVSGTLDSPAAALDRVSGRLAVAGSLSRSSYGTGRGVVTFVSAIAANPPSLPDPFHDRPFEPTSVGGGDTDARLAEVKCLSEAAEFLVSGAGLPEHAVYAAATSLNGPWMSPEELISYPAEHRIRLGVSLFDDGEPQWWVPGHRSGERIWLPAALVVGRVPSQPGWFHPTAVSSSGVAAHPERERAIRSAWLEGVERDAFQRSRVLAGSAPPDSVRLSSIPTAERRILRTLTSYAAVSILLLPSPTGCPVILVRTDTEARIGLGCAASHDPVAALRHALIEAVGQAFGSSPRIDSPEQVRTPGDHAGLYAPASWRSRLDWMRSGRSIQFGEIPAVPVRDLPAQAAVYTFEMPIALPLHVVRVVDPALIPITFGYDSDPDGRRDFAALSRQAGHDPTLPLDPHPLA